MRVVQGMRFILCSQCFPMVLQGFSGIYTGLTKVASLNPQQASNS